MSQAKDNSLELMADLKLTYNDLRQTMITNSLIESLAARS